MDKTLLPKHFPPTCPRFSNTLTIFLYKQKEGS